MSSGIERAREADRKDQGYQFINVQAPQALVATTEPALRGRTFGQPDTPHSDHYRDSKIQPWDVIDDWDLGFYAGNILKYIKRLGKKEGESALKDAQKIQAYADKLLKVVMDQEEGIK